MGQNSESIFQRGIIEYQKSQFQKAEFLFRKAISQSGSRKNAEIWKMLGISQYMQQKFSQSSKSFKIALKINPIINISPLEILDDSVIPFFKKQKLRLMSEEKERKKVTVDDPFRNDEEKKKRISKKKYQIRNLIRKKEQKVTPINQDVRRDTSYHHFLPFGLPQFYNSEDWIGSVVFGTHLASLLVIFDAQNKINRQYSDISDIENSQDQFNSQEEVDLYLSESYDYIDDLETMNQISLIVFVGTWVISAVEGVINAPIKNGQRRNALNQSKEWEPHLFLRSEGGENISPQISLTVNF